TPSYGASASFTYGGGAYGGLVLTGITDAAGINSQISYWNSIGDYVTQLITPYGTTSFSIIGDSGNTGIFDRTVKITRQDGTQEFYALMNQYPTNADWPDFLTSQIPTNPDRKSTRLNSSHVAMS